MSRSYHNPFHLRLDKQEYWVSASTTNHGHIFDSDEKLEVVRGVLRQVAEGHGVWLRAWIALPNHYHTILRLEKGKHLGKVINTLHGRSSNLINRLEDARGRKVWHQY